MVSLIVRCFHSGRQLLGLAEGVHQPSFLQREGECTPFFIGAACLRARHSHGTHHQHGRGAAAGPRDLRPPGLLEAASLPAALLARARLGNHEEAEALPSGMWRWTGRQPHGAGCAWPAPYAREGTHDAHWTGPTV
jgi:hypothetical protein